MTDTAISLVERRGERGSALIAVLLLLMMMTALAGALSMGGQTETFVSRNQNSGAQAQSIAEAGLNHAVELVVTYIFEYNSNGFATYEAAVDALLAGPDGDPGTADDNTSLAARAGIDAAEDIPLGVQLGIAGAVGVTYDALVMDDDDGDGNLTDDINDRLIIRATGYGPDNSKVTLEAIISPASLGAIVTEADLELSGNVKITSSDPNHPDPDPAVHSNGDIVVDGTSTDISGTVTATGTLTTTDADIVGSGSAARVPIPKVNAADYEVWADYKLHDDGRMETLQGAGAGAMSAVCTSKNPCNGWSYDHGSGTWSVSSNTSGTYYVEGNATVSGSPGSKAAPVALSIIAEGNIDISGTPKIVPDAPELLFVTNKDLKILGSLDVVEGEEEVIDVQGQMLVREQVELGGNVSLLGQLIVEDALDSSSTLVTSNHIHGNVVIEYAGGLGSSTFTVTGWRDVRDAD
jgi:Tfp pilus assembly protein PilX